MLRVRHSRENGSGFSILALPQARAEPRCWMTRERLAHLGSDTTVLTACARTHGWRASRGAARCAPSASTPSAQ